MTRNVFLDSVDAVSRSPEINGSRLTIVYKGRYITILVCKLLRSACLSVWPVHWHIFKITRANFIKFSVHLRPWLGPPLTAMQYVMYFRFCG